MVVDWIDGELTVDYFLHPHPQKTTAWWMLCSLLHKISISLPFALSNSLSLPFALSNSLSLPFALSNSLSLPFALSNSLSLPAFTTNLKFTSSNSNLTSNS